MAPNIFDDPRFLDELDQSVERVLTTRPLSFLMKVRLIQFGGMAAAAAAGAVTAVAAIAIWPWIESTAIISAKEVSASIAAQTASETALKTASFVSSARAAAVLLEHDEFKFEVAEMALSSLSGSVVAFVDRCPDNGWEPYNEGAGKFLVGVGEGTLIYTDSSLHRPAEVADAVRLTAVVAGQQGGAEMHTLVTSEIPSNIGTLTQVKGVVVLDEISSQQNFTASASGNTMVKFDHAQEARFATGAKVPVTDPANTYVRSMTFKFSEIQPPMAFSSGGKDQAHNNMPPYIALYFCKKV